MQQKAKPRRDNSVRNIIKPSASVFKHAYHMTSIDENFIDNTHRDTVKIITLLRKKTSKRVRGRDKPFFSIDVPNYRFA